MIRILQIGMSDNLGGIETFIINMYRFIDKKQVQFDFIDFTENGICFEEEILSLGGKIYKVPSRKKNIIQNKKQLEKIMKQYKIIHYHANTLSYFTPIAIAKKNHLQIILHSHNQWKGKKLKTLILHKMNQLRLPKTNITRYACSDVAAEWLFLKKNLKLTTIIKNAVDCEKFRFNKEKRNQLREELGVQEKFVIGHIGRFSYQKNHDFLIKIFQKYYEKNKNSCLFLFGIGELEEQIKQQVKNLGLEKNVFFFGIKSNTYDYLQAIDLILFPSFFEGFPIVLIEAQAAGVPCLISDTITKQVQLFNFVKPYSLEKKEENWANELSKFEQSNHIDTYANMCQFGYHLTQQSEFMLQQYKSLFKEE